MVRGMPAGPRLRQVALVAADCDATSRLLQQEFGWPEPFHDPGVGRFGLTNSVFAAGDTFIEVVAPVQPGTTAGRYLDRRGGDSGYMAIFQMPDLAAARRRVAAAGVRVVWTTDHGDIAGTHLHPKDVPGAIVSLDCADPPESWRWAGPDWTGRAPATRNGGVRGLTIEVIDPGRASERWASVLGLAVTQHHDAAVIELAPAGQDLRFVTATGRGEAITEVRLSTDRDRPPVSIAGVRFVSESGPRAGEAGR
jgi:Glyoxalase-like domain